MCWDELSDVKAIDTPFVVSYLALWTRLLCYDTLGKFCPAEGYCAIATLLE